jgi:parallel beta-helix repeat protein
VIGCGLVALAALGAAVAAPALATTTTLYVGPANCSDLGTGSQAQPYCTIGRAASVAGGGTTVLVAAGTYHERVATGSGTAGNPVVFQAAAGATVIITGGTNGFAVLGRHDVTISGFTVTGTSSYGIYVSGSSNVLISGNTVSYAGQPASGQTAAGIYLGSTTASTVTGNNTNHNSDHGIYLTTTTSTVTVTGNESSFNANQYQRNANGIDVIGPNNTIIGNLLHDNEDSGLQFYTGGNNGLAALNVSYNNGDHGIDDLNVTGGRLIGNTIYHNCTSGINVEGTSGNYLVENNISVDNAVFVVNPTPEVGYTNTCNRRAGNIGIWDSAPASTTVDANLVWLSTPGTLYVFGSSYTTLAAMRSATGQETHGTQADPHFVNPGAGNLRVNPGSAAIDSADSGASGEQAADITGTARVDDPGVANTGIGARGYDDRGAYEFTPSGALPPIAQLTVTPSSGTAPLAVTANASGSTDPQGQPLTYTFDFGDATHVGPQAGATAGHTFTGAGSFTVTVTVTDTANLSATASTVVSVTGPVVPGYVSQIATNNSTSTHTSGSITVWRSQGVVAGDLEVVTLQLTGTSATGAVTGSDDAGNVLSVAQDVADASGDRLVVLSGVVHNALVPNDKISVSFPSATSYRMTGDELSGVTTPDQQAGAAGSGGGFASGATGTTSAANELVYGAVGGFGGGAPSWSSGWTALTTYPTGTNYLGRAYRVVTATGSFNATGTLSGGWLASCVTFR